jgi:hypothetical protein
VALIVDNPASRLFDILSAGKARDINAPARNVWSDLLNVPLDMNPLLISRLALTMELPSLIVAQMAEHYPDEAEMTAYWSGQVNQAFLNLHLAAPWNGFIGIIDTHSMHHLRATSKHLQHVLPQKPMGQDAILELRARLNETLTEVVTATIEDSLKLTVVHYLRRLINSLDEYFITGAAPALDAVNAAFGNVITDPKYKMFLQEEGLGTSVLNVLNAAASVVTIAMAYPAFKQIAVATFASIAGS